MASVNWLECTETAGQLLPLHSLAQALDYLGRRARWMVREAQAGSLSLEQPLAQASPTQERLWRLDRAAAFWVAASMLPSSRQPGVALFGPRAGDIDIRGYSLCKTSSRIELGDPWDGAHPLLQQVSFASEALQTHGVLTVRFPITAGDIDQQFGRGAWERCQAQASQEQALRLAEKWECALPMGERERF